MAQPKVKVSPSTSRAKAEKHAALDAAIKSIRIDGEVYTVDPAGITGSKERVIVKEIGQTVLQFVESLEGIPGVYTLGVFMWIARLSETATGQPLPELDPILDSIGYGSEIEVIEGAPDRPEA